MEEEEEKEEKDDQECSTFRIILLGDSVGKTSIIKKYVINIFEENYLTTIGMNMSTKEILLKKKQKN